jgi:hypothetical protein
MSIVIKALYLHGKDQCRWGRYKCDGIRALPGEAFKPDKGTKESAEPIVVMRQVMKG